MLEPISISIIKAETMTCPYKFSPDLPMSVHKYCNHIGCMRWVTTKTDESRRPIEGYCR